MEVDQKLDQLLRFLAQHGTSSKVIVYFLTCACVDFYALALKHLAPTLVKGLQVRASKVCALGTSGFQSHFGILSGLILAL